MSKGVTKSGLGWLYIFQRNSVLKYLENEVLGFFLLGGVRFWYGWPILLGGKGTPVRKCKMKIMEIHSK